MNFHINNSHRDLLDFKCRTYEIFRKRELRVHAMADLQDREGVWGLNISRYN